MEIVFEMIAYSIVNRFYYLKILDIKIKLLVFLQINVKCFVTLFAWIYYQQFLFDFSNKLGHIFYSNFCNIINYFLFEHIIVPQSPVYRYFF